MRKLPFIATTLLCSSLAFAQEDYQDDYSTESAVEAPAEAAPADDYAPAEEPAPAEESYAAAEESSDPYGSSYESAAEEPAPAAEEVAEAPAPKAEAVTAPAPLVGAPATLSPEDQIAVVNDNIDTISNNLESTLMGKDDAPLAVSGFMAVRAKNFQYSDYSKTYDADRARTSVDAIFKANIVAMPNSFMTLWTNLTFPFDFSGLFTNNLGKQPTNAKTYDERVLYDHSTDYYASTVDEEMNFGVDIRAGVFGAYVTAGGVIWANASPLTMWERETNPRFAWQYELFEDEKTVSTYYKEKVFKPVKEGGRAFWTNRSFGGVFANVYQLPYDFKAQFMVSQPADMDVGTRDGLRMYGGQPGELEMSGDYDFRGAVYHGRVAKDKVADMLTIGANYIGLVFDEAVVYEPEFSSQFRDIGVDEPYFTNVHVASLDAKGNITPKLYLMVDLALSMQNTLTFRDVACTEENPTDCVSGGNNEKNSYDSEWDTPQVGVYVKAQSKHLEGWPITAEAIFLPKNFYSPYSIENPSRFPGWRKDEMYLNAGSMRYSSNLTGINLKIEPEFNRGHLDLQYGLHRQIEDGDDVLMFNYRLNGRNMWESTNSWTKHKPLFWADSGNAEKRANGYIEREGVLTRGENEMGVKMTRQQGGLRGGTWELWESYVAYENIDQIKDSIVPSHTKWSTYLSVAGGYDIGHWFGTDRNIVMSGYASISGISKTIAPIAYSESQSDMLLWSFYGQFEPAIAITPSFHLVGCLGLETFRSEYGYVSTKMSNGLSTDSPNYREVNTIYFEQAPINYLETAIGAGFDWDFSDRVGLHVRYKLATHSDEVISANDFTAHYISAETKMWF